MMNAFGGEHRRIPSVVVVEDGNGRRGVSATKATRRLPHVPKRFVVPRACGAGSPPSVGFSSSAAAAKRAGRGVSFEDEVKAREEEEEDENWVGDDEVAEYDGAEAVPSPPAILRDYLGPAPATTSNNGNLVHRRLEVPLDLSHSSVDLSTFERENARLMLEASTDAAAMDCCLLEPDQEELDACLNENLIDLTNPYPNNVMTDIVHISDDETYHQTNNDESDFPSMIHHHDEGQLLLNCELLPPVEDGNANDDEGEVSYDNGRSWRPVAECDGYTLEGGGGGYDENLISHPQRGGCDIIGSANLEREDFQDSGSMQNAHGMFGNESVLGLMKEEERRPFLQWSEPSHRLPPKLNRGNDLQTVNRLRLETNPPGDRMNLVYLTLVLHGVGTLMPWNMMLSAKELKPGDWIHVLTEYFANHKHDEFPYSEYFLNYVGLAAQIPNLAVNWINVFLRKDINLTRRIAWTLLAEVIVFVVALVLAVTDAPQVVPGAFFYITIVSIVVLNLANGVYLNTVFGLAAMLPFKYAGAVLLGSNLSGIVVALLNIVSIATSAGARTAAIYYFITALFVLLACVDTHFALPLNRFFRYHVHNATLQRRRRRFRHVGGGRRAVYPTTSPPYLAIFQKCFPQCLNLFLVFFVTLAAFPAMCSNVKMARSDFVIPEPYFTPVTCFLTFSLFAAIGNVFPSERVSYPRPRWLVVPVALRFLFLPIFMLCNYKPNGVERLWPVLVHWDWAYWTGGALLGFTGGYLSSLAMMYCPRCVEPEFASVAGMFGAASIVTGVVCGFGFSHLMPAVISHPSLNFDHPTWWPPYVN